MEILATELAKLLNITVENAIELYPMLKQQFISYKMFSSVGDALTLPSIVSLITIIISGVIFLFNLDSFTKKDISWRWEEEERRVAIIAKKVLLIATVVFVVSGAGLITIKVLQYTYAPDFMMIKEFLIR